MQGIPHHFIDSHRIADENYSAGRFRRRLPGPAQPNCFRNFPVVVLTGGSGLYVQAVTDGLDELPGVPPEIRARLLAELATHGLPHLVAELAARRPRFTHARIDQQNPAARGAGAGNYAGHRPAVFQLPHPGHCQSAARHPSSFGS